MSVFRAHHPHPELDDEFFLRSICEPRRKGFYGCRRRRNRVRRSGCELTGRSQWLETSAQRDVTCRMGLFARAKPTAARLGPMKRAVRCFVMWLLVLALPVQGFAASTMLLCGAGHHGSAQTIEGGHDHASHMHLGAQDDSAVSESPAHDDAAVGASSHEGSSFSPLSGKHAKVVGKCSACAACCTVAFLPTTVIAFTAPAPSRALEAVELTLHVGFFTDGPDRPPRLLLA